MSEIGFWIGKHSKISKRKGESNEKNSTEQNYCLLSWEHLLPCSACLYTTFSYLGNIFVSAHKELLIYLLHSIAPTLWTRTGTFPLGEHLECGSASRALARHAGSSVPSPTPSELDVILAVTRRKKGQISQGHSLLYSESEANLAYMKLSQKKTFGSCLAFCY